MQSSLILNLLKFLVLFSNLVLAEPALTDGIELPGCAQECMASALLGGICFPTDQKCQCTNDIFQRNVTDCVNTLCSIPEALLTQNISLASCGVPTRDRSHQLTATLIVSIILSIVVVALRFIYKLFVKHVTPGLDDWLTFATLASGVSAGFVHLFGTIPHGLGRDIWTLEATEITKFGLYFYNVCWVYFMASALLKLAMIAFYMRIFTVAKVQRLLWGTFIFTSVYGVIFVIAAIFNCRPVHFFWTKWDGLHHGTCLDANAVGWSNAIIGIVLDLWILGIPLWQLRHLQLHWKKKVAVTVMLVVGALVTIVSIVRLHSLVRFETSQNITWDFWEIALWSGLEICIGIVCACLPTIRLLLIKVFPYLGDNGDNLRGPYEYHSQDHNGTSSQHRAVKPGFGNSTRVIVASSVLPHQHDGQYPAAFARQDHHEEGDEMSLFHISPRPH